MLFDALKNPQLLSGCGYRLERAHATKDRYDWSSKGCSFQRTVSLGANVAWSVFWVSLMRELLQERGGELPRGYSLGAAGTPRHKVHHQRASSALASTTDSGAGAATPLGQDIDDQMPGGVSVHPAFYHACFLRVARPFEDVCHKVVHFLKAKLDRKKKISSCLCLAHKNAVGVRI